MAWQATVPAGQTNVSLRLDAVSDSYIENDELATLTITDAEASGYGASPYVIVAANASVTIRDDGQGTIPTVTITAPDSSAFEPMQSEDQADSGQFLIKRTGDTGAAMVVSYVISGEAVRGADYAWFNSTVTIPANQSEVRVNVDPYSTEWERVRKMSRSRSLAAGCCGSSDFTIGTPSEATVTIHESGQDQPMLCDCDCSCEPEFKADETRGGLNVQAARGLLHCGTLSTRIPSSRWMPNCRRPTIGPP